MNYFFITGTSRGIGQAIKDELIGNPGNQVYGYSRSYMPSLENYSHQIIDLSNPDEIKKFSFPGLKNSDLIVLINNSGTLGEVGHVGSISNESLIDALTLNLIAPAALTNAFINQYKVMKCRKLIINISSGAGKNPYDGWGAYCASKAGLDMFSRVIKEEQSGGDFEIYSIAPGVVDTQMQTDIRKASENQFSRVEDFINYKENNILIDPVTVAKNILSFIFHPKSNMGTVFSLKEAI